MTAETLRRQLVPPVPPVNRLRPAGPVVTWQKAGFWLVVAVILVCSLFPFWWIVKTSLQSVDEFTQGTQGLLPAAVSLEAYGQVLSDPEFLRPVVNSIAVCTTTTAITVVLASLAGYGLARLRVRRPGMILAVILLTGFFPVLAMVGPLFLVYRTFGLLDGFAGLVLADLVYTLPIATWLLYNFFAQIPASLEEAALIDGASRMQALWHVIVPVAVPGVFTAAILSFILAWNDFAFALSFLQTPESFTAPLALVNLGQSQFQVFYNVIDAAVVVITLPVALLVLFAQKRIVSGLTAGAVK
jgi:ABC-type glycerol-3-phosphate transport system permease component